MLEPRKDQEPGAPAACYLLYLGIQDVEPVAGMVIRDRPFKRRPAGGLMLKGPKRLLGGYGRRVGSQALELGHWF